VAAVMVHRRKTDCPRAMRNSHRCAADHKARLAVMTFVNATTCVHEMMICVAHEMMVVTCVHRCSIPICRAPRPDATLAVQTVKMRHQCNWSRHPWIVQQRAVVGKVLDHRPRTQGMVRRLLIARTHELLLVRKVARWDKEMMARRFAGWVGIAGLRRMIGIRQGRKDGMGREGHRICVVEGEKGETIRGENQEI